MAAKTRTFGTTKAVKMPSDAIYLWVFFHLQQNNGLKHQELQTSWLLLLPTKIVGLIWLTSCQEKLPFKNVIKYWELSVPFQDSAQQVLLFDSSANAVKSFCSCLLHQAVAIIHFYWSPLYLQWPEKNNDSFVYWEFEHRMRIWNQYFERKTMVNIDEIER